jgi:hypothetical protein
MVALLAFEVRLFRRIGLRRVGHACASKDGNGGCQRSSRSPAPNLCPQLQMARLQTSVTRSRPWRRAGCTVEAMNDIDIHECPPLCAGALEPSSWLTLLSTAVCPWFRTAAQKEGAKAGTPGCGEHTQFIFRPAQDCECFDRMDPKSTRLLGARLSRAALPSNCRIP